MSEARANRLGGLALKLRRALRIARMRPERALSLREAQDALELFRLHAKYAVPEDFRRLWLIEEAREAIALAGLKLQSLRSVVHPTRLPLFIYLQIRLWLLLKALEGLERAEGAALQEVAKTGATKTGAETESVTAAPDPQS